MSNPNERSKSGNTGLAFIVGILVAAVAVLGFIVFDQTQADDEVSITLDTGGLEDAAQSVEDAVKSN